MAGVEKRVEEFLKNWRDHALSPDSAEKKTRKCLVCDQEFVTFSQNHICSGCHKRYEKLFSSAPTGQYEDLIYSVLPSDEEEEKPSDAETIDTDDTEPEP